MVDYDCVDKEPVRALATQLRENSIIKNLDSVKTMREKDRNLFSDLFLLLFPSSVL